MSNNPPAIPGPRRPLDGQTVLNESLTFDATLTFRVTLSRSDLAATRRRMVAKAIDDGHAEANETWFSDQDVVEYNIYEWIASGDHTGEVTSTDSTVWTV